MTEDFQVTSGVPEYNGNMPSEKPQLPVIDIIDQMANSIEIFPYENAEFNLDSLLTQADQKGDDHFTESTACGVSGREKEHQGLCEESYALEGTKHEEGNAQQLWEEEAYSMNEAEENQGEVQLQEHKDQTETERYLEVKENATAEDFDGAEEVMKSHKKGQETNIKEFLPFDPRSNSQIENPNEQPGSMKKSDISRHTYSRYNTISYRKIRKGNTKQRIDEFESMMHS